MKKFFGVVNATACVALSWAAIIMLLAAIEVSVSPGTIEGVGIYGFTAVIETLSLITGTLAMFCFDNKG